MSQLCSTNYTCQPVWYTSANMVENGGEDVVAQSAGPHAEALNVTCVVKTGTVQFQVQDETGAWFTPAEASYTVNDSNLVRLPRANMPMVRIIATADATFAVAGDLR